MASKKVLVVDDEDILRKGLCTLFTKAGYDVLSAASGNEALAILEVEAVDIVLTDVRMRDGGGIDLIKSTKRRDPFVPVIIFMSGYADLSLEEVYDLGATAILSKPFERHDLLRVVERSLDVGFSNKIESNGDGMVEIHAKLPENSIGRGGFQIEFGPALRIGVDVDFQLGVDFGEQCLKLEGRGVVRWVKRGHSGQIFAGVEIIYLAPESKLLYGAWLNVKRPVSYIPKAA